MNIFYRSATIAIENSFSTVFNPPLSTALKFVDCISVVDCRLSRVNEPRKILYICLLCFRESAKSLIDDFIFYKSISDTLLN